MLIALSGLSGTGKTTIARQLARELAAVYLRIDSIEQSLCRAGWTVESEGYSVAHAIAEDNLGATIPAAMQTNEDICPEKASPCPSCASAASVSMVLQIEAGLPAIYPLTSKVELAMDGAHFVCRCSDCGCIWNPDDLDDSLVAKLKVRIAEQRIAKWGGDSYF